jgi:hypothetical protein
MLRRVRGSTWLVDVMAATMLATAGYCAARVVIARLRARATQADVDLAHVAMGLGMAYMLLRPPGALLSRVGLLGFGLIGGYFAARSLQHYIDGRGAVAAGQHLQHAVGSGAMLLMFVPLSRAASGGHGMLGMADGSTLEATPAGAAVAFLLLGLAVLSVGRLVMAPMSATQLAPAAQRPLTPRLAVCCQALMSAAMCYLLMAV